MKPVFTLPMKTPKRQSQSLPPLFLWAAAPVRRTLGLVCVALGIEVSLPEVAAQDAKGITIEGRVLNATNGQYLHNSRITINETKAETFTDENGSYRLTNVRPGPVTLAVYYTGLQPQTATVTATAGETIRRDFALSRTTRPDDGSAVKLDEFVVAENRQMNAQSVAINEQRFASQIRNVASADEHGDIGESNFGEFIKYLPGVSVNYSGGVIPTDITVRGFPASATQVTMDGGEIASAGVANTNRQLDLSTFQVVNNIARVEVFKTPTPDQPANILGGTVNLITKSAFERDRPQFTFRVYGTANSNTSSGERPSPGLETTKHAIQPAGDFSYTAPINKNFGFTVSGAYNARYFNLATSESTWTLPANILGTYQVYDSMQLRRAASAAVTVDWKFGGNNMLSASLNNSDSHVLSDVYYNRGAMGAAPTGGPTFTQSTGTRASFNNTATTFDRLDQTWHGSIKYRHNGPVWKIDGSGFISSAVNHMRYIDKGAFSTVTATLATVVGRFDQIGERGHPGPGTMSATTAAGSAVDIYDASNYLLLTTNDGRRSAAALKTGGQLNFSRRLDWSLPIDLKSGVYLNRETRDQRTTPLAWTFLGPDGIANNADNRVGLYDFIANVYSAYERPYNFPQGKFISAYKVFQYSKAHPEQFSLDNVGAISGRVNGSTNITERVSAAYVRGDVALLNNRLRIVTGVRFERTEDEGDGPLNDLRATFQKDSAGRLLRAANGSPIKITTDPVANARLQYIDRGAHADRNYSDYYPSLNAVYNLTDNLLARFAYARTIGRPQFNDILPGLTVSDPGVANPNITVNNTGLKPWVADAYDLSLEYYFGRAGQLSIGGFRKNISDFIGSVVTDATPAALAELGLGSDYAGYTITTDSNVGAARISGFEFNYRQALEFLPSWAGGVQVFANGTFNKLEGDRTADFTNFSKRNVNWGISLSRTRYTVKLNWLCSGEIRGAFRAAPDIYFYTPGRTTLDASFEFRLFKHWGIYGTARNLTNSRVLRESRGSATPAFASNNRYFNIGSYVSAGIKGEF